MQHRVLLFVTASPDSRALLERRPRRTANLAHFLQSRPRIIATGSREVETCITERPRRESALIGHPGLDEAPWRCAVATFSRAHPLTHGSAPSTTDMTPILDRLHPHFERSPQALRRCGSAPRQPSSRRSCHGEDPQQEAVVGRSQVPGAEALLEAQRGTAWSELPATSADPRGTAEGGSAVPRHDARSCGHGTRHARASSNQSSSICRFDTVEGHVSRPSPCHRGMTCRWRCGAD